MARFSIFGASGFIGSHLRRHLEAAGHEVTAITRDDFPDAGQALGHAIYCIGLTADFRQHLLETVRAHVGVLAEVVAAYRFDSFLYLSSTRVYAGAAQAGEETPLLVKPDLADHAYNLSKLTGESICLTRPQAGFRVARLSNVIGHGASPTNFLPAILDEARRTGTVTLRTSERSSKDYIDVDDVSPLLEQIALRGTKRIYNVASGANTTNLGIADLIRRRIGAKVTFSATSADIIFSSIDISRIRAEFRFVPAPFVTSFEKLIGTPQGEAAIENDHHH